MNTAQKFITQVDPHRKKHLDQDKDMFGIPIWRTKYEKLTNLKIENAINGTDEKGYFSRNWIKAIVLDIDNHNNIPGRTEKIFSHVRQYLPEPTYTYKSPNGLHPYWILNKSYPIKFIVRSIMEYLPIDLLRNIEIRPTTKNGLRIPKSHRLIEKLSSGETYHYGDIFSGLDLIECEKENKKRKAKKKTINYIFLNGYTNETLIKCTAYLYYSEVPEKEAVLIIQSKMFRDGYTGELIRKPHRLIDRVASSYRNLAKNGYDPRPKQYEIHNITIAEQYRPLISNRRPQYQKTFIRFIALLVHWIEYINKIKNDRIELDYWSALYPTFRDKVARGYYPLSFNTLYKMTKDNNKPKQFIQILTNNKIITAIDHSYSNTYHICKYYKIDLFKLLNPQNTETYIQHNADPGL